MAMRVTTKMMQGTSLSNLNTNKSLQDKLNIQMSTLKNTTRPSDDPVIAIRSLRLNCTLTKVEQYYKKNSKDAEAWLDLTDESINTVSEILESMRTYMVQGSNGDLEASDRAAITQNLNQLMEEIYSVGNTDYEGRTIFTGYRTGEALSFQKETTCNYTITEQNSNTEFDTTTFVRTGDLSAINEGNFNATDATGDYVKQTTQYDVETYTINRMRLAYSDLEAPEVGDSHIAISYGSNLRVSNTLAAAQTVTVGTGTDAVEIKMVSNSDGSNSFYANYDSDGDGTSEFTALEITGGRDASVTIGATTYTIENTLDANGIGTLNIKADGETLNTIQYEQDIKTGVITFDDQYYTTLKVTDTFANDTDDAYMAAVDNENAVVYIAETGEVLFGSEVYNQLSALSEDTEIRFTYDKQNWDEGDLNPIHYFSCTDETGVVYNSSKLVDQTSTTAQQVITYDVGNNQKLQVNTTADEVFTQDIGRDIEEKLALLDQVDEIETVLANVQAMIDSGEYADDDLTKLEEQRDGLAKSQTLLNDKLQMLCESYQTKFDNYLSDCTLALTKVGSREARQQLVDNRLGEQKTTFETLVSENEDADMSELAVQLSSVELTYEAALSSISYLMKTTLLDYL